MTGVQTCALPISLRKLERDVAAAKAIDPYQSSSATPVALYLADKVGEKTLHMVTADPARTPTLTMSLSGGKPRPEQLARANVSSGEDQSLRPGVGRASAPGCARAQAAGAE